jgi:hypothetical protein
MALSSSPKTFANGWLIQVQRRSLSNPEVPEQENQSSEQVTAATRWLGIDDKDGDPRPPFDLYPACIRGRRSLMGSMRVPSARINKYEYAPSEPLDSQF